MANIDRHFKISMAKSVLRIFAGAALIITYFSWAGALFIAAEALGILEEL